MANRTYLLSLSSGNIAPIMNQQGDDYVGIDTDIDALLSLTSESVVSPRYRIFILNSDDTIQEELPTEDILSSGSFSENYQNGQRCSLSLTLYNQDKKYIPTINKLWVGTKLRLDAGIECQDGSIIWVQKGVFVITSTQPSYGPDTKLVNINAGDKFSELEQGCGILSEAFEIEAGSKISSVVKELLATQRKNGVPIDSQEPWFHPKLINKLTQAKISKNAGDTIGSIILDLINHMSAEVFYNSQGRLCFFPVDATSDDNDKPILFNYIAEKGELTNLDFQLDYSNIINRIILIGATVNGGVVKAEASNQDPYSPLCVQRIGTRTSVINESDIKTKIVAEENAKYQLRKQLILKSSVSISPPFNPLFGVNNLIMITDDFYGLEKQYFLIQSISFNLDYSNTLSMSISNLSNLPFISSYRANILDGLEDAEIKNDVSNLIAYPVTVNIDGGECSGVRTIYRGGKLVLSITPSEGRYLPSRLTNVQGASYTYDNANGTIVLYNPIGGVIIDINCPSSYYRVSLTVNGGQPNGSYLVGIGGAASVVLIPNQNKALPPESAAGSILATDVDVAYDSSTGVLVMSNPISNNASVVVAMSNIYSVIGDISGGGILSDITIKTGEVLDVKIYCDAAHDFPLSVSVNNVTATYDRSTGVITLSNPTGNVKITATCQAKTYSLTKRAIGGAFVDSHSTINYNQVINLLLKADSGYAAPPDASGISISGASILSYVDSTDPACDKILEITKNIDPTLGVTVVAQCIRSFSVAINITNGEAINAPISIEANQAVSFTIVSNSGYSTPLSKSDIICNGCDFDYNFSTGTVTLYNAFADTTLFIICSPVIYSIQANVANGSWSGEPTISHGGSATITFIPDTNYEPPTSISSIQIVGDVTVQSYNPSTGVLVLENVSSNITINAQCYFLGYPVSINSENCNFSPSSAFIQPEGSVTFTITPSYTYVLPSGIDVRGVENYRYVKNNDGSRTLTISNPTGSVLISLSADAFITANLTYCRVESSSYDVYTENFTDYYDIELAGESIYSSYFGSKTGLMNVNGVTNLNGCDIVYSYILNDKLRLKLRILNGSPSFDARSQFEPVILKVTDWNDELGRGTPRVGITFTYDINGYTSSDGYIDNGYFYYYLTVLCPNGITETSTFTNYYDKILTTTVHGAFGNSLNVAPYSGSCPCIIYLCRTPIDASRTITHTATIVDLSATLEDEFIASIVRTDSRAYTIDLTTSDIYVGDNKFNPKYSTDNRATWVNLGSDQMGDETTVTLTNINNLYVASRNMSRTVGAVLRGEKVGTATLIDLEEGIDYDEVSSYVYNLSSSATLSGFSEIGIAFIYGLEAPTITIEGNNLHIDNKDELATAFDIYVNGTKETTLYLIDTIVTNGTFTGDNFIQSGSTTTITITANSGYVLPNSISVVGASYTYSSSTGIVGLSNPTGKVTITCVCEEEPSGYTVSITPAYAFTYTIHDGQDDTAAVLGTVSANNTIEVLCTSGYLYITGGGPAGAYSNPGTVSGGVSIVSNNIPSGVLYSVTGDGTITGVGWGCFVEGTQITLADYTTKNIEDITYEDELLVWDFYEGKLSSAKPTWIMPEHVATEYKKVTLSDGTIMKLVGSGENCHRLFNITKQQMLYANECIGDEVYKQDGTIVTVLSCEKIQETVKYYNLTTDKYYDCFAEGVLTGSRLNNMYHISNMKYDSNERLISEEEEAERWQVRSKLAQIE